MIRKCHKKNRLYSIWSGCLYYHNKLGTSSVKISKHYNWLKCFPFFVCPIELNFFDYVVWYQSMSQMIQISLVQLGSAWLSLAQLGSAWLSLAQLGWASICFCFTLCLSGILSPKLASFSPKPIGHVGYSFSSWWQQCK